MSTTARKKMKRLPKGPNGGVQLLLIENIQNLGKSGELVEVRPGYANNYLIPQGLATIATEENKKKIEEHQVALQAFEAKRQEQLKDIAKTLAEIPSITIESQTNEAGHLYGSVGVKEIADAIAAKDIKIPAESIQLEGPLKEIGMYSVRIALAEGIEVDVKTWVVPDAS